MLCVQKTRAIKMNLDSSFQEIVVVRSLRELGDQLVRVHRQHQVYFDSAAYGRRANGVQEWFVRNKIRCRDDDSFPRPIQHGNDQLSSVFPTVAWSAREDLNGRIPGVDQIGKEFLSFEHVSGFEIVI